MRTIHLLVTVCIGLLTFTLMTAAPAAGYERDAFDQYANRSRTFAAYQNDQGTVFEIKFTTQTPNEKRKVRANFVVEMPSRATDDLLVSRHAIFCAEAGSNDGTNKVYGVQNILRGKSMVLQPRYIFTAPNPGAYHCWLWIGSGRPRPSGYGTTSNVFRIGWGSYLEATTALHTSSEQSFAPDKPSKLLANRAAYDAEAFDWTAPQSSRSMTVSGDSYLTACTSAPGSTDPVTGIRMCDNIVDKSGSTVRTRLIAYQRNTAGTGYCATTRYPSTRSRETYISRNVHHRVLFHTVTVPISTSPDCSRTFRIKLYVAHVKGSAVIVHRQGTITMAIPPL